MGYEALSRGPQGSALETANALFGAGERFNLTVELELACARQAVPLADRLPEGRWLSINLGLAALATLGAVKSLGGPASCWRSPSTCRSTRPRPMPAFCESPQPGGAAGAG